MNYFGQGVLEIENSEIEILGQNLYLWVLYLKDLLTKIVHFLKFLIAEN